MRNAIILAGGKGERLRPYTDDRPKPMIPILANPLLSYQLRWLSSHGIDDVAICCGYKHEVIADYFADGSKYKIKLNYLIEAEPLGRGGALKNAFKHFGASSEPIIAMNGDCVTNINLTEVVQHHKESGALATVVTVPLISPYGIIELKDDGAIHAFTEKPRLPYWINAGIYVLEPSLIELLPDNGDHEDTTFPQLVKQGKLKAYKTNSFWRTVDTVKDLTEIRSDMENILLSAFFQAMPVPV